ncbi:hypothetical protein Atai01_82690 [Amycolatopsis taiwanensis]|uniref:Uncharacterized protein n=1 Tax=Amycolatopsis taiwanensis TaxID=342230 RepID=A0A9W6RCY4_9PSEU|nr:hypothetical protein Atai01_82690 [Amycolatopsis taiwanensis]
MPGSGAQVRRVDLTAMALSVTEERKLVTAGSALPAVTCDTALPDHLEALGEGVEQFGVLILWGLRAGCTRSATSRALRPGVTGLRNTVAVCRRSAGSLKRGSPTGCP